MTDPQLQGRAADPGVNASDISSHKNRLTETQRRALHPAVPIRSEQLGCLGSMCCMSSSALKRRNGFINKSEPITIKLLSVFKIIIKIKEMIYSEDFR